jgi:hypothetical protein
MSSLATSFWSAIISVVLSIVILIIIIYRREEMSLVWLAWMVGISSSLICYTGKLATDLPHHGLLVGFGYVAFVLGGAAAIAAFLMFGLGFYYFWFHNPVPKDKTE